MADERLTVAGFETGADGPPHASWRATRTGDSSCIVLTSGVMASEAAEALGEEARRFTDGVRPSAIAAAFARTRETLVDRWPSDEELKRRAWADTHGWFVLACAVLVHVSGDGSLMGAHVGPDRWLVVRAGRILAENDEHTYGRELADEGLIAADEAWKSGTNILTRAMTDDDGCPSEATVADPVRLAPGDRIVLCQGGRVSPGDIARDAGRLDPAAAARAITERGRELEGPGGRLITVVAAWHGGT